MSHTLTPRNLNKDVALVRRGKPDYSKLDADAFPTPTDPRDQGAILEVTDTPTGERYRWTGSLWVPEYSLTDLTEVSARGDKGVKTYIQDQTTGLLDLPFLQELSTSATLAVDTIVDTRFITLSPGHGAVVGNWIELGSTIDGSLFMQARIIGVVGDVIEICTPVNRVYTPSTTAVILSNDNLAVNGSVTPVVFRVNPTGVQEGDMVRFVIVMTDNAAMDFETFGGIVGGLTRGLVFRINNGDGTYRNIVNYKTNGQIELYAYDARYFTNIGGGTRGFSSRKTWGGQDKQGVVVRLNGSIGESLEVIVQDDLTSLISLYVLCMGHEVQS